MEQQFILKSKNTETNPSDWKSYLSDLINKGHYLDTSFVNGIIIDLSMISVIAWMFSSQPEVCIGRGPRPEPSPCRTLDHTSPPRPSPRDILASTPAHRCESESPRGMEISPLIAHTHIHVRLR